ncbi:exopolysaccharide biosynthesis polyprenyl glycosylphosphotransferase [Acidisoma cladoniae]|jgi:Undecaprenyl-phosphate glucose phosphotransferase|uniref:exopolysaccharide biosynthesis polyprenyl glycosylphosphotransferase n=1 Tax=Acidisoma cladoniae TaxID=3040935 RepID=UPI00254B14B5|nr:exopolysaccharide biosynthesis polyprenyl glycosylphosphotransferase [Acidisoma sp. PAMC 29798]
MSERIPREASVSAFSPWLAALWGPPVWLAAWDGAIIGLTGLACRQLNPAGHAGHTSREMLVIAGTAALAACLLQRRGLYDRPRGRSTLAVAQTVLNAFGAMLLALLVWEGIGEIWQGPDVSMILANRNWLFAWAVAAPALLALSRGAVASAVWRGCPTAKGRRAIIIGGGDGAARLAGFFREDDAPLHVVGFLGRGGAAAAAFTHWPILRDLRAARAMIQSGDVDLVIIALPETAARRTAAIMRRMAGMAVDIRLAPDVARFYQPAARISSIGGLPFLHLLDKPMSGVSVGLKRAEDVALACLLLCLAAPAMAIIALAIRGTSPGPAFFIQPRLGFNHRVIAVWKFRTMYQAQSDAGGRCQAVRDDPRVTPLGRLLRRASLDELPQLFNVIGGSMALVGPRPHALGTEAAGQPFEAAAADYAGRHRVKPGITGWAQVNGCRGETDTVEKLRRRVALDLHYIDHWSVGLDLRILAMTLVSVLRGNAY